MRYNRNMWTVYLVKINEKQYVGITSKGLDWRRRRHLVEARRGLTKTVFHNSLAKNQETSVWSVLAQVDSKEEAILLEKRYIKDLNTLFPNGLNLTKGGDGFWGIRHTKESKQKISKGNLGLKRSKVTKKRISNATRGLSKRPQTQIEKDLKSIARGSKPFDVFLKDGTFLGRWTNKSDCSKKLNISRSAIIRALKIKTHNYNSKYIIKEVVGA